MRVGRSRGRATADLTNHNWVGLAQEGPFLLKQEEKVEDQPFHLHTIGIQRLPMLRRVRMFHPTAGRIRISSKKASELGIAHCLFLRFIDSDSTTHGISGLRT